MKKICAWTLAVFLLCALCVPVFAETAAFARAWELFEYWEINDAYPDYVSGVWSTYGGVDHLTIGVLDTEEGNAGKEEILALIEDDTTVSFAYGAVSYKYLTDVMEQLGPYFEKGLGLSYGGVDVMAGKISLGILEERQNDPATLAMLEEMRQRFGADVFTVEYTDSFVFTYDTTANALPAVAVHSGSRMVWLIAGIVLLLAMLTAVLVIKKRQQAALQTSTGETVTADQPLSVREVEDAVRQAQLDVPVDLDKKIFEAIEKK